MTDTKPSKCESWRTVRRVLPADIHTHNQGAEDAVINLERGEVPERQGVLYSAGWHPWWGEPTEADRRWLLRMALHPQVVMVGECGIDRKRGAESLERQVELLRCQALLAERVGKLLLLHVVGGLEELLRLRRELKPLQPWIVHGFRGKPELARQLVRAGVGISLGQKFNAGVPQVVPAEMLFKETD